MARLFRFLGYHYERYFRSHPIATLAIANGFCSICGDAAAQLIPMLTSNEGTDLERTFDFTRLLRYFVFGLNMGPIGGKWNEILDRHIQPRSKAVDEGEKAGVEKDMEMTLVDAPDSPGSENFTQSSSMLPFWVIFQMVLADQLLMAPFSIILFLSFMGLTEGIGLAELQQRIGHLFWKLLVANWKVWPIIQVVNFRFMPLRLRVPFSAGCGILWTIFLSYASSS
ncbi:hypothetical protein CROQUDRAFT_85154 [Cronartium quercuum f. sp. fusiforme G11]|uniref:Uncharacterized protein n=1 Tax=Cronartium quercuum f. sp. fusiforme G11 TaxID=708437 RepID=A0A9P6N803_9BASI|nr:hypothetical protein CROQUDRAFT_85154 [Cronartium quercuum f. sp. fusiforme G11]